MSAHVVKPQAFSPRPVLRSSTAEGGRRRPVLRPSATEGRSQTTAFQELRGAGRVIAAKNPKPQFAATGCNCLTDLPGLWSLEQEGTEITEPELRVFQARPSRSARPEIFKRTRPKASGSLRDSQRLYYHVFMGKQARKPKGARLPGRSICSKSVRNCNRFKNLLENLRRNLRLDAVTPLCFDEIVRLQCKQRKYPSPLLRGPTS